MALPTVRYASFPKSPTKTFAQAMLALQGLLFDAGWTIAYADATAIGTGSAESPAWDATPANGQPLGKAIYVMPANGFTRQWYVQLNLRWSASSTTMWEVRVTVGTGESGGTLLGAGQEHFRGSNGTVDSSLEVLLAASEDGFAWVVASANWASAGFVISVERARTLAGVVEEDLIHQGFSALGSVPDSTPDGASARHRASDGFEYAPKNWAVLGCTNDDFDSWLAVASQPGFTDADGAGGYAIGPFATSGKLAGVPRLISYMMPADVVSNSDHPISVDGAIRLYRTPTDVAASGFTCLVPRE